MCNEQTLWTLQIWDSSCCRREQGSSDTAHQNAYRQLRLYTICHFPETIRQSLRKDLPRVRSPLLGVEPVEFVRDGNLVRESGPVESLVKELDF